MSEVLPQCGADILGQLPGHLENEDPGNGQSDIDVYSCYSLYKYGSLRCSYWRTSKIATLSLFFFLSLINLITLRFNAGSSV